MPPAREPLITLARRRTASVRTWRCVEAPYVQSICCGGGARLPFTVVAVDCFAATSTAVDVVDGPASDLGFTEDETSNERDDLEVTVVDPVTPVETSFSSI